MILDVHPGFRFFSHPGSRGQKSTGTRIRNSGIGNFSWRIPIRIFPSILMLIFRILHFDGEAEEISVNLYEAKRQNMPGNTFKKMRYFISTVFFQRSELKTKIRIRNTAEQIVSESYSSGIRIFSFEVVKEGGGDSESLLFIFWCIRRVMTGLLSPRTVVPETLLSGKDKNVLQEM
jgi:hypothetical protein